jgi:hypothetical protein
MRVATRLMVGTALFGAGLAALAAFENNFAPQTTAAAAESGSGKATEFTLKNGLKVVVIPDHTGRRW